MFILFSPICCGRSAASTSVYAARGQADSSAYFVTFDADKRIESIVYYMPVGADSQQVKVPGADGLMLPATLYRPRGCGTSRNPAIVLLHGWLYSWREALCTRSIWP